MALDTSADDSALIGTPVPQPEIDPSMLLLDPLGNGVLDAGGLQQQKEDAAKEASIASSSTKRKRVGPHRRSIDGREGAPFAGIVARRFRISRRDANDWTGEYYHHCVPSLWC